MKKSLLALLILCSAITSVSAQEFFSKIKLPKKHEVLDFEAVEGRGVYILSGQVENPYERTGNTKDITLHFFDESLAWRWSTGILDKLDNHVAGTLKILADSTSSDVGLVFTTETKVELGKKVETKFRLYAVLVDSLGNASSLKTEFLMPTKNLRLSAAAISRIGIHAFCKSSLFNLSEFHFSFSENKVEKRFTFPEDFPHAEIIGRRSDTLLFQDPIGPGCFIREFDLIKGTQTKAVKADYFANMPSVILRPSSGTYSFIYKYRRYIDHYTTGDGKTMASFFYMPNQSALISFQWLKDKQEFVSLEIQSDLEKNKKRRSNRRSKYHMNAFIIRKYDKDLNQLSSHIIPFTKPLLKGKTKMTPVSSRDEGYFNTYNFFYETDTSYLISSFNENSKVSSLYRVNTESNTITKHQYISSRSSKKIKDGKGRSARQLRSSAAYSSINMNQYPMEYYNTWLKSNQFSLGGKGKISTTFGQTYSDQFYFINYDSRKVYLAIWKSNSSVKTKPGYQEVHKPKSFALIMPAK